MYVRNVGVDYSIRMATNMDRNGLRISQEVLAPSFINVLLTVLSCTHV